MSCYTNRDRTSLTVERGVSQVRRLHRALTKLPARTAFVHVLRVREPGRGEFDKVVLRLIQILAMLTDLKHLELNITAFYSHHPQHECMLRALSASPSRLRSFIVSGGQGTEIYQFFDRQRRPECPKIRWASSMMPERAAHSDALTCLKYLQANSTFVPWIILRDEDPALDEILRAL